MEISLPSSLNVWHNSNIYYCNYFPYPTYLFLFQHVKNIPTKLQRYRRVAWSTEQRVLFTQSTPLSQIPLQNASQHPASVLPFLFHWNHSWLSHVIQRPQTCVLLPVLMKKSMLCRDCLAWSQNTGTRPNTHYSLVWQNPFAFLLFVAGDTADCRAPRYCWSNTQTSQATTEAPDIPRSVHLKSYLLCSVRAVALLHDCRHHHSPFRQILASQTHWILCMRCAVNLYRLCIYTQNSLNCCPLLPRVPQQTLHVHRTTISIFSSSLAKSKNKQTNKKVA